jgi:hypothetical protein
MKYIIKEKDSNWHIICTAKHVIPYGNEFYVEWDYSITEEILDATRFDLESEALLMVCSYLRLDLVEYEIVEV